jgi:two-component system response regulator YesN
MEEGMSNYKVVIIDDEPWTREVIKTLADWDALGLVVAGEASDGEYGLELIRLTAPDIILTDVKMPHLNGIELITTLRKENNDTPVIFISGYDDYSFIRSALKLDAVDYLLKPIKQEELNYQLSNCVKLLADRLDYKGDNKSLELGFIDAVWANKFYVLRDNLESSLNSPDINIIKHKCNEIYQLIQKNMDEKLSKGNLVCIYYTLMNTLENFILSRDFVPKEILKKNDTSFVFSRDSSPMEMMDFIQNLYCIASEQMQEYNRNRNRLDIGKIKKYLEEHYTEGITLEFTAAAYYVSKEYLSKAFKAATGKGFLEYLTELRMERAKELILDYKIPLKEVGEMVGYLDQAHFYKTFKRYFGKTPGEVRGLIIDNK